MTITDHLTAAISTIYKLNLLSLCPFCYETYPKTWSQHDLQWEKHRARKLVIKASYLGRCLNWLLISLTWALKAEILGKFMKKINRFNHDFCEMYLCLIKPVVWKYVSTRKNKLQFLAKTKIIIVSCLTFNGFPHVQYKYNIFDNILLTV